MRTIAPALAAILLSATSGAAEVKYFKDGKVVGMNSAAAADVHELSLKTDLDRACAGLAQMQSAFEAFKAHDTFPLRNNEGPATDVVAGFLELAHWLPRTGVAPVSFEMIRANITADRDKAFSREERDNVVRLWEFTGSWMKIDCRMVRP